MSPRNDLKCLLIALFEHSGKKRFSFFARSLIAKLKSPDLSFDRVDNLSRRFNLLFYVLSPLTSIQGSLDHFVQGEQHLIIALHEQSAYQP